MKFGWDWEERQWGLERGRRERSKASKGLVQGKRVTTVKQKLA